ncbi:MAG: hypothetical protein WC052_04175 [Patescibacteria group bacterium]
MDPLKLVLCNGSLSASLRVYLGRAGYDIGKADRRGYCGTSTDGSIEFWERDRRMVPYLVAGGYDAGITGLDLTLNSCVQGLRQIAGLCFSRATNNPTRWVLASKGTCDLSGSLRIGCELENLPALLLPACPYPIRDYQVVKLEGNEEMAIEEGLCDLILVVTETGSTLQALSLTILPGCERLLVSVPQIIAKGNLCDEKEEALQALSFALTAVIGGSAHVMLTFDIPKFALSSLQLPGEVAPTVSPLLREGWCAVQICIDRSDIGKVGRLVELAGGRAIVAQDILAYSDSSRTAR